MNRKKIIVLSFLVVFIAGLAVFFLLKSDSSDNLDTANSQDSSLENTDTDRPTDPTPETIDQPKPNDAISIREESYEYTETILSPNDIATNPDEYLDKEITTRCWLIDTGPEYYSALSINVDEQTGLIISKNKSIDLSNYTDPSNNPEKQSSPVKLTGSLSNSGENGKLIFIVTSASL